MVVLFNADPVLCDFPSTLSGSATIRSLVVFTDWLRGRIFRALPLACRLAAKWLVGVRWVRDLSLARVRARNVTGDVAHAIHRARGMAVPSRRGISSRTNPLPCGVATLQGSL